MTGPAADGPIRVLLVDDQAIVRLGFRMIIDAEDDLVVAGEAADGLEAIAQAGLLLPDVVVMDVRMPRLDGIEATRRLAEGPVPAGATPTSWPPKVLVVTTFDLDDNVFGSLEAGASGFLLKHAPPEQLLAGIRTVAAGDALVDAGATRRLIEHYVRPGGPAAPDRRGGASSPSRRVVDALTERERDILRGLARGRSNARLAAELFVSESTVKTHVSNLLAKLGLRSRVQAVVLAYESGLVEPTGLGVADLLDAEDA